MCDKTEVKLLLLETMDKLLFVYNQFYYNFVDDVLQTNGSSDDIKEKLTAAQDAKSKHGNPMSTRNMDRFIRHVTKDVFLVLAKEDSADVLKEECIKKLSMVKKVSVGDLVGCMQNELDVLRCYIYVFALLGYTYVTYDPSCEDDSDDSGSSDDEDASEARRQRPSKEDATKYIEETLSAIKAIQKGEQPPKLDDATSAALVANIAKVMKPVDDESKAVDDDITGKAAADMLQNTKIGNLAKEISEELDLSSLNISKPEDLLNMGSNGVLGNIIGKVGSKIHAKIDKGELKHEDLMSEAMSMMSMLGGIGGGDGGAGGNPLGGAASFLNNPMFKDIMKNMGGIGNLANLANMAKNSDKGKSAHVKDRLRKKLDERKAKSGN